MTAVTRRAVAGALALGVLALGGCSALAPPRLPEPSSGSATPTPSLPTTAEAFRDARTFALAAESGHLTGTLGSGRATVTIDLEGSASGSNQRLLRAAAGRGTASSSASGRGAGWPATRPSGAPGRRSRPSCGPGSARGSP